VAEEDCAVYVSAELDALLRAWEEVRKPSTARDHRTRRIFLAKAVILLCLAPKGRDADHLNNLATTFAMGSRTSSC
jgi:hypothetical protein